MKPADLLANASPAVKKRNAKALGLQQDALGKRAMEEAGWRGERAVRHKFNAKPTEADGIKFSSKKEAKRYAELKALRDAGEVVMFLRQTPFHLTGGVKYVLDFLVFWADGTVTAEDVKGMKTPMYKLKKKQVEALYPVTITEV